jgi:hypothetical protein
MQAGTYSQQSDVVELALDEIDIVGGGFPVIPPASNGG